MNGRLRDLGESWVHSHYVRANQNIGLRFAQFDPCDSTFMTSASADGI